jgi:hypothetical protein
MNDAVNISGRGVQPNFVNTVYNAICLPEYKAYIFTHENFWEKYQLRIISKYIKLFKFWFLLLDLDLL